MKVRRKKLKRKRGSSMSFGDLVRELWQPESAALEPKLGKAEKKTPAGKSRRGRKR
jgi:hypothetical protein